jgi:hypothetical protein
MQQGIQASSTPFDPLGCTAPLTARYSDDCEVRITAARLTWWRVSREVGDLHPNRHR